MYVFGVVVSANKDETTVSRGSRGLVRATSLVVYAQSISSHDPKDDKGPGAREAQDRGCCSWVFGAAVHMDDR